MSYITTNINTDGFGSQYQRIIESYIFSKYNKYIFHYRPFSSVEHNYSNDPLFLEKKEKMVNLIDNIENIDNSKLNNYKYIPNIDMIRFFEKNIDLYCEGEHMNFIKKCFWENKDKNFFKNEKVNVAVHIRRINSHDGSYENAGNRVNTPNSYFFNIINALREKYKNKELLFHIYSQGIPSMFSMFVNQTDIILHLNSDFDDTFIGMVAADVLVTSPSSLSYVAGLLSDGEVWYKQFWHPPRKTWIVC